MNDLPDAPWIRDAELNGVDAPDDYHCPVCGEDNPEWFYIQDGELLGCEFCVEQVSAADWADAHREECA